MTLSLENLSTRLPSPFAETLTAALLLGFSDLLLAPVNLAGRAGAKVAVNDAIFADPMCLRKMLQKAIVLLIDSASWLSVDVSPSPHCKSGGKSQISTGGKSWNSVNP